MTETLLERLAEVQEEALVLFDTAPAVAHFQQQHIDLSPLAWHLGHLAFIETYWIREVVLGDDRETRHLHDFYFPERSPKARRGPVLAKHPGLLPWVRRLFADNRTVYAGLPADGHNHRLLRDGYLLHFLVQHHCQHLETMHRVCLQHALARDWPDRAGGLSDEATAPRAPDHDFPATTTHIGRRPGPEPFDNELSRHAVRLDAYRLAGNAVINAEYLGFMQSAGYRRREFWDAPAWRWQQDMGIDAPLQWRQGRDGSWHQITAAGPVDLDPVAAVDGIGLHEARAFARYAGCRLPHEREWEHAVRDDAAIARQTGQAWEWCDNPFYPYPGYTPFPYDRYSQPWFDGSHYALRGGSRYTHSALRRPSFRNFYTADKRHIFAGLRLAVDG